MKHSYIDGVKYRDLTSKYPIIAGHVSAKPELTVILAGHKSENDKKPEIFLALNIDKAIGFHKMLGKLIKAAKNYKQS